MKALLLVLWYNNDEGQIGLDNIGCIKKFYVCTICTGACVYRVYGLYSNTFGVTVDVISVSKDR